MATRIKRKRIDNRIERQIITGMVVSTRVLRELRHIYKPTLMEVPFAKTVAKWCFDYYKRYEKAPREHIQDIFNSHVRKGLDDDTAQLIGDFLSSISQEYEGKKRFNAAYLLDQAEERFRVKNLAGLAEDIKSELVQGNTIEAEALLGKYKKVARPTSTGINPFTDKNAVYSAFEEDVTPLFTFPGAAGRMLNDQLTPDNFIGIMGPEKRGKSWWADEFAFRASRQGCNTVLFKIGDMSRSQALRRLHIRLAAKSHLPRYCGEVLVPVLDCVHNQMNMCKLSRRKCETRLIENRDDKLPDPDDAPDDYAACSECERRKGRFVGTVWWERRMIKNPLTWREGLKLGRQFMRRARREFKLDCHPDKSIGINGLNAQLDVWENIEGFVPSVIVVDMIDNLLCDSDISEFRHQQDEIWAGLRAMSQKRHCLMIGTTESDSKSATQSQVMTMENFTEDKRKMAHVTGMLGLNQTMDEKDDGVCRLNWVVLREGDYSVRDVTYILQCLRIGRPCIASYR